MLAGCPVREPEPDPFPRPVPVPVPELGPLLDCDPLFPFGNEPICVIGWVRSTVVLTSFSVA